MKKTKLSDPSFTITYLTEIKNSCISDSREGNLTHGSEVCFECVLQVGVEFSTLDRWIVDKQYNTCLYYFSRSNVICMY